jgi:hypothetical protein
MRGTLIEHAASCQQGVTIPTKTDVNRRPIPWIDR